MFASFTCCALSIYGINYLRLHVIHVYFFCREHCGIYLFLQSSDSMSSLKSIAQQAVVNAGLENQIPTPPPMSSESRCECMKNVCCYLCGSVWFFSFTKSRLKLHVKQGLQIYAYWTDSEQYKFRLHVIIFPQTWCHFHYKTVLDAVLFCCCSAI